MKKLTYDDLVTGYYFGWNIYDKEFDLIECNEYTLFNTKYLFLFGIENYLDEKDIAEYEYFYKANIYFDNGDEYTNTFYIKQYDK